MYAEITGNLDRVDWDRVEEEYSRCYSPKDTATDVVAKGVTAINAEWIADEYAARHPQGPSWGELALEQKQIFYKVVYSEYPFVLVNRPWLKERMQQEFGGREEWDSLSVPDRRKNLRAYNRIPTLPFFMSQTLGFASSILGSCSLKVQTVAFNTLERNLQDYLNRDDKRQESAARKQERMSLITRSTATIIDRTLASRILSEKAWKHLVIQAQADCTDRFMCVSISDLQIPDPILSLDHYFTLAIARRSRGGEWWIVL